MTRLLSILCLGLALAACAEAPQPDRPGGCHGPRRPANPHGSVLAPEAAAQPATPAGALCAERPR